MEMASKDPINTVAVRLNAILLEVFKVNVGKEALPDAGIVLNEV
jgi:hypothetical protein